MDTGQRSARITVKTIVVHRFDHRASRVEKFETYPRWGAIKTALKAVGVTGAAPVWIRTMVSHVIENTSSS
jgi:hypothetical protein